MHQSIHGHEIMEIILAAGLPHSRQTLGQAVAESYGGNPRFHTCSAQDMTLDDLLAFLISRGKVIEVDGFFQTAREQICDH
jgi:probable metal-binding protein